MKIGAYITWIWNDIPEEEREGYVSFGEWQGQEKNTDDWGTPDDEIFYYLTEEELEERKEETREFEWKCLSINRYVFLNDEEN